MKQPDQFDEAEAKRILGRAAEIDAHNSMDANALRQIALEAGISPAAVDKAVEEHLQAPAPQGPSARFKRLSIFLLVAVILGVYLFMRMAVVIPQP